MCFQLYIIKWDEARLRKLMWRKTRANSESCTLKVRELAARGDKTSILSHRDLAQNSWLFGFPNFVSETKTLTSTFRTTLIIGSKVALKFQLPIGRMYYIYIYIYTLYIYIYIHIHIIINYIYIYIYIYIYTHLFIIKLYIILYILLHYSFGGAWPEGDRGTFGPRPLWAGASGASPVDTILYCSILYYMIRYCTILYYTILYYTILYYTILWYTILYYTILDHTVL